MAQEVLEKLEKCWRKRRRKRIVKYPLKFSHLLEQDRNKVLSVINKKENEEEDDNATLDFCKGN